MDLIATLKVNDCDTGELVERIERTFTCDEYEYENFDAFCERYADEIQEYLENLTEYDYEGVHVIFRFDILPLADDYDDDDDDDDDDEPTPPDLPEWGDNIIIRRMREGVTK